MRKRYIQDPKTGKLHEVGRQQFQIHHIQGEIEPFKSPIDGSLINSRKQLEAHNRRHNVTQDTFNGDYAAKQKEREAFYSPDQSYDSERRKAALNFSFESLRGSKTKGELKEMAERYAEDN